MESDGFAINLEELKKRASEGDVDACYELGSHYFFEDEPDDHYTWAYHFLKSVYDAGDKRACEYLGLLYYDGVGEPFITNQDIDKALMIWEEGAKAGYDQCALQKCLAEVDNNRVNETTIATLESLVAQDEPIVNACDVLSYHYYLIDDMPKAILWRKKGREMGAQLLNIAGNMDYDLDNDSALEDNSTEESANDVGGDNCVIIVDVDGCFSVVKADASNWEALPELIDAERTDNLRCKHFNDVSRQLHLPGNLIGLLDRDAFRKPDLEPNWHASQWYNGYADLYGDMIICMEDNKYNTFSFANDEQANAVIEALRQHN